MKNKMMKLCVFLLAFILVLPMVGCSSGGGSTKVTTAEEVKNLSDDFYAGLAEADPVSMTTFTKGEETSVYVREGDKIYVKFNEPAYAIYAFKDNGKAYTMQEGESPMADDTMYDMYRDTVSMTLDMFVNGFFSSEDKDAFTFDCELSAKDEVSTLTNNVTSEQDGQKQTLTITGKKSYEKVDSITVSSGGEELYRYEFAYDVHVNLPEHTIVDHSADYKTVESPFATVADVTAALEEGKELNYISCDTDILIYTEKDGRQLQLRAPLGDLNDAYQALDPTEADFREKEADLIKDLAITECIDYTDALLTADELGAYTGSTVGDLFDEGYEGYGYTLADVTEIDLVKDGFIYRAAVSVPEDFADKEDINYEDFEDAFIEEFSYLEPSMDNMPLK